MPKEDDINLDEDERRGKVVTGVPLASEELWRAVQAKAEAMNCLKAVNEALSKIVVTGVKKIHEAVIAKASASTNGSSLTER